MALNLFRVISLYLLLQNHFHQVELFVYAIPISVHEKNELEIRIFLAFCDQFLCPFFQNQKTEYLGCLIFVLLVLSKKWRKWAGVKYWIWEGVSLVDKTCER